MVLEALAAALQAAEAPVVVGKKNEKGWRYGIPSKNGVQRSASGILSAELLSRAALPHAHNLAMNDKENKIKSLIFFLDGMEHIC